MKIGISVRIDVKKIEKARLFAAQSGASYLDLTMFLDPDNEGQYGDHGFITQSLSKEERAQGAQMPILGNGKIFYGLNELKQSAPQQQQATQQNYQQAQVKHAQQQAPIGQNGYPQQKPVEQLNQQSPAGQPQQGPDIDFTDEIPF